MTSNEAARSASLAAAEPPHPVTVDGLTLDNGLVRVEFAEDGTLASVRDLAADREVLGDKGNLLRLHTDLPNYWDAWDVDKHYKNRYTDLLDPSEITVTDTDPLLGSIRVTRPFGNGSTITQTITVRAGSPRIDFETDIDWHEAEKLLKLAFPLDIAATHTEAETQFGYQSRVTHVNTSWEAAKFETSMHRFVLVREPGFGVALLNDSLFGYDTTRDSTPEEGVTTTVRLWCGARLPSRKVSTPLRSVRARVARTNERPPGIRSCTTTLRATTLPVLRTVMR